MSGRRCHKEEDHECSEGQDHSHTDRGIIDHYLLGDTSPNGLRTKRTDFVQRLEQAGFSEWTTLEKFWEVRDFLACVLGVDRVLVSKEGFNAVGRAGREALPSN